MSPAVKFTYDVPKHQLLRQAQAIFVDNPNVVAGEIAQIAADLKVPVCAVTIVDEYSQYFLDSVKNELTLTKVEDSFCRYTILQDDVMVVEDATKDPRFRHNPYVLNNPRVRFYAGAPLHTTDGQRLGAICVLDDKPRSLSPVERRRLADMAATISRKLCFHEQGLPLNRLSAARLLDIIRTEPKSPRERMVMLIEALYDRLDHPD